MNAGEPTTVWNPRVLGNATRLADAYRDMPRDAASRVPFIVRLLENPRSPLALPGAVDLFTHDCIHLVLGRGLLSQDEAFVLGFTMGSTRTYRALHVELFTWCARFFYPRPFRFDALDAAVFEHGVRVGSASGSADLSKVDFRAVFNRPLGELRRVLGICSTVLAGAYREERERWPGTQASARLASST